MRERESRKKNCYYKHKYEQIIIIKMFSKERMFANMEIFYLLFAHLCVHQKEIKIRLKNWIFDVKNLIKHSHTHAIIAIGMNAIIEHVINLLLSLQNVIISNFGVNESRASLKVSTNSP